MRLLEAARVLGERRRLDMTAARSVLLVLDMQEFFLDEASHAFVPSAIAIIPHIKQLQELFLQQGLPVIHTFHTNDEKNAGSMKRWWRDLLKPASPLAAVTHRLPPSGVAMLEKHQYDAFLKTDLEDRLRRLNIRQVVVTGVMAHLCCETTARSAFMRGFDVLFVVDAVADYNREFHRATVLNLAHGFATPVLTDEVIGAFGN